MSEKTLDDLLHRVITKLLASKDHVQTSRGCATEITGALLALSNPRARLSRTEQKQHAFSSLGELLWYLSGSNQLDFITYYVPKYAKDSDDGVTIHGGYGPRLMAMHGEHNQLRNVIALLSSRPSSRRAVIQLFDASDIAEKHKEIPCTCTLQFIVREERLHVVTYMRSNDAFIGLPHDIFTFTMIQEIVARHIGKEVGSYKHAVGSLHLYDEHRRNAETYLREGIQARIAMPPMPTGDPSRSLQILQEAEFNIRTGGSVDVERLAIAPYWQDLVRLLQIFRYFKQGEVEQIRKVSKAMASDIYGPYIEQKRKTAGKKAPPPVKGQLTLPLYSKLS